MSEEDIRAGLLDAVANEPPLRFDPDELITTARRQVRRRALVAAGVATVVVAVAAVAVPAALGRGSGTAPVADRPTVTTNPNSASSPVPTTRPDEWPPAGVDVTYRSVAELRQRGKEMGQYLRGSLPTTLAPATDFEFGEFGGEAAGQYYSEQAGINAATTFTLDGKRYSIMVTSWLPGTFGSPAETCLANCHRLPDQAGGALYEQTEEVSQGGVIETAMHFRDTGAVVTVAAYNYDMTGNATTYHPSLPVPLDQLVAIATAPELEL